MDRVIGGKFKVGRKIGSGSFGELFLGIICQLLFPGFYFKIVYVDHVVKCCFV